MQSRPKQENEILYNSIINSTLTGFFVTDKDLNITQVNNRLSEITGLKVSELARLNASDLGDDVLHQNLNEALGGNPTRQSCLFRFAQSDQVQELEFELIPLLDSSGQISGVIGLVENAAESVSALESLRSKANQLEALYNSGRLLGRTLNLDQTFDALHESLKISVPCDGLFLSSYNPHSNIIRCEAAWADDIRVDTTGFPELMLEPEGKGTQSMCIRSGEPIILNDYEANLRTAQKIHHVGPSGSLKTKIPDDADRTRSAMILPLKLEEDVIGVIQIFSYKLNAYTTEHLRLAESMAFQAAAAQNNAILYKMAQDELDERTRSEQLQTALYRIAQTVHSTGSLDDLLREMHLIIGEVLPASNFYVSLYDEDTNQITFPYFKDEFDDVPQSRIPGRGLTEYVLKNRNTYLWRSSQADPTVGGAIEVLGRDAAVWLGVPLFNDGKVLGVMAVQHYTDENAYGERERQVLDFVATEVARAITAMNAVKAIRESEDKYRSLIENTREGIFLWSMGRLEIVNQTLCDLLGYDANEICSPEFNHQKLIAKSEAKRIPELKNLLNEKQSVIPLIEINLVTADGNEFEAEVSTNPISYKGRFALQGVVRDVSHRRRIEAQLLQTAKLEAIGRLAGGVAHDFNNLLTAISGTTELLMMRSNKEDGTYNDLQQILTISRRGSNLTRQLLAFARSQPQQPRIVQINSIIVDTEQMLRRLIGDSIQLSVEKKDDLPTVKADPAQLEMALMNLVVNSRDAMPTGGIITIKTDTESFLGDEEAKQSGVIPGDYSVLSVTDEGMGMTKEVLDRATDPFFTTKPIGKGTGLGLSTVHGIARQSGGYLRIISEVGVGTTVKMLFPISGEVAAIEHTSTHIDEVFDGRETILVCDDEETVRQVAVRILEAKGYNVLQAKDGQDALDVAFAFKGKIDLLLTDMAMPVMDGTELAEKLVVERPGLKVIMMSGYSPMAFPNDLDVLEPKDFVQKPFRAYEIANKVRAVLDAQPKEA